MLKIILPGWMNPKPKDNYWIVSPNASGGHRVIDVCDGNLVILRSTGDRNPPWVAERVQYIETSYGTADVYFGLQLAPDRAMHIASLVEEDDLDLG